jgi:hypothetical protein
MILEIHRGAGHGSLSALEKMMSAISSHGW